MILGCVNGSPGDTSSYVYGSLDRGIFEGSIRTENDNFYVERASKYFNGTVPFQSVFYSAADVEFPNKPSTTENAQPSRWCGLYGHREIWMNRVLKAFGSSRNQVWKL